MAAGAALVLAPAASAHPTGSPSISTIGALITKRPASPTNQTTAKFAWKRIGHVTKTLCRLDAIPWRTCKTKITYTSLLPGVHTFRVKVSGRTGGRTRSATKKVRWTIDITPPSAPVVSGGSASWAAGPVTITGSGSTDPGGAVARYEHRTSPDGSAWSPAAAGGSVAVISPGQTFVQVRAVDTAGNASAWAPAVTGAANTAMVDATGPTTPVLSGALAGWQNAPSETVTAAGSVDGESGLAGYQYRTSVDAGASWSGVQNGALLAVSAEGRTDVQFRAVDAIGNRSPWAQATVRLDNVAPTAPAVSGGNAAWRTVASVLTAASGSTDAGGSGVAGYEYETSTDGGSTWSAATAGSSLSVSAEDETLVRYAAVDGVGLESAWTQAIVRLDHTAPSAPTLSGGSPLWQNVALASVTAGGSIDSGGSGLDHYRFATSTDGGATWTAATTGAQADVTAQGETLVRFAAVDAAGNASAWVQATIRIDTTPPSDPSVSGGSSAWKNVASVTASASGSTDAPGSGIAGYEHETSTDGGANWSLAAAGSSLAVTDEGETLVRFRAVDTAGFTSGWKQATVRIDRTAPSAPSAAGGSLSWQSVSGITITGSGSTDTPGSGVSGYQYRTSTDGGASWSGAAAGGSVDVTANGETLVQFRAVDVSGLRSAWAPAAGTAAATARVDRGAAVGAIGQRRFERVEVRRASDRHRVGVDRRSLGSGRVRVSRVDRRRRHLGQRVGRPVGRRLGRGRDAGAVPEHRHRRKRFGVDAVRAGGCEHRAARPDGTDRSQRRGRLARVAERRLCRRQRVRLDRRRRLRAGDLRASHLDRRRSDLVGGERGRDGDGLGTGRDARPAARGRRRGQHVGVDRGHRPDRPQRPGGAKRRRRLVRLAGVRARQRLCVRVDRHGRIGPRAVRVPHQPERRGVVGRHRRRVGEHLGRGDDAGAVPKRRRGRQRVALDARRGHRRQHGQARPHVAHEPDGDGRLGALAERRVD